MGREKVGERLEQRDSEGVEGRKKGRQEQGREVAGEGKRGWVQ